MARTRVFAPIFLLLALLASEALAVEAPDSITPPQGVQALVTRYCGDCHGEDVAEADVRFSDLAKWKLDAQLELLNKAHEQLHFHHMPPEEAEQPTPLERAQLASWLSEELDRHNANLLDEKLRRPDYGNYVEHDKLFSGEFADLPGYTYDRRWLISEFIFNAKFNRILRHKPHFTIDGQREYVVGSNNRPVPLTNPFLLPTDSGVRYYANETLNGGHLLTMLTNAKEASATIMGQAQRDQRYLPAVSEVMSLEDGNRATLASRKKFLDMHIAHVLREIDGDRHESLLPDFVPVQVPEPLLPDANAKKAPYHAANPGKAETELIFRSMRRHRRPDQTYEQLLEACEREWFYHFHDSRQVQTRLTFLINYQEEFHQQTTQHKYDERLREIEYRPLADEEMRVVTETIRQHRQQGDRYQDVINKCLAQWETDFERQRIEAGAPTDEEVRELVEQLFVLILERGPRADEAGHYVSLGQQYASNLGRRPAIEKLIQTLLVNTEFVYRLEFGQGPADEYGRRMLSPQDASYALAYALTDSSPDAELAQAAEEGRLNTREDYEREVRRMLARRDQVYIIDEAINQQNDVANFTRMPIRELRFFREFFGYPNMFGIFKDDKRFGGSYDKTKRRLITEADRLVEHIVEQDQDVFGQLLTTDRFYVYHSGDNAAMQASSERIRRIYDYFHDKDWRNFTVEDLAEHKDFIAEVQMRGIDVNRLAKDRRYDPLGAFKTQMESFTLRLGKGQTAAAPYNSFPAHGMANASTRYDGRLNDPEVAKFYNIDLHDWDYPTTQPTRVAHRRGMLTHPAWLIAFAGNTETDPIHRGKWVREKLLADTIPDLPITVDAVIPEDPHKSLRQRLDAKTGDAYCAKCHVKMNPLGLPFEMYDDFGRYRTEERLEYPENLVEKVKDKGPIEEDLRDIYKTLPVDPSGRLDGTGDSSLDGEVSDALDLIDRLSRSDRVRQSIIRHAFRYFLGRNEMLSDSKTLIDADRTYIESGGSFDELVVSLLTSDSFIYRKTSKPKD